ncbi:hypothetical protein [Streptomyces brevispora]|uniref:Phosphotransferase family enzyme n=1 Tax=Streptomyces brevispora TaxID=887462 RepID=A0ABZ1FZS7_9ACTN|nr:hypothetical protein [Streptomyces brevispora]WSC12661.1 hypothetical protein OIE64_07290 [Streptomyces brevispora]
MIPPSPDTVFTYAAGHISRAAAARWPQAPVELGPVIPSVTSYVQQVDVNGRSLYAKVSILGVSLVSVLRGTHGGWDEVRAAQAAYLTSPRTLLARETAQLALLHGPAALNVPAVAAYTGGVLFTEPAPGPTLTDLILKEPHRTAFLLSLVTDAVATGLERPGVAAMVDRSEIRERSITGTFRRKFNGISGGLYLRQTDHAAVLTTVVSRLRRALHAPAPPLERTVVFGDLKPEHAVFPNGAQGKPVFLDPGLMRGSWSSDTAKLISRTVLQVLGNPPARADARAVLDGITGFAHRQAAQSAPRRASAREAWMRHLVVLWLADTVNILTTYLSAPDGLPLPPHARRILDRSDAVCGFLDRSTAPLLGSLDAESVWRLFLTATMRAAVAE